MTDQTTATVPTYGTHCRTCSCPPPDSDYLSVGPPHERFYGRCETCGQVRWETEIHALHRGSGRRSKHCGCCTHPHDLQPGGHTIPHREYPVAESTDAARPEPAQEQPEPLAQADEPLGEHELRYADLTLNTAFREITRGGRTTQLTRTECALLELLMRHAGDVVKRADILREVWGFDFPADANSLDVYVGYLRRKTEAHGGSRLLQTVRGAGYAVRETGGDPR